MTQQAYPDCQQISDAGFGSHEGCYLEPVPGRPDLSWCNLSISDQWNVAWIVKDAGLWEIFKEGLPILMKCAQFTAE